MNREGVETVHREREGGGGMRRRKGMWEVEYLH